VELHEYTVFTEQPVDVSAHEIPNEFFKEFISVERHPAPKLSSIIDIEHVKLVPGTKQLEEDALIKFE
jgi:hypothetical protein